MVERRCFDREHLRRDWKLTCQALIWATTHSLSGASAIWASPGCAALAIAWRRVQRRYTRDYEPTIRAESGRESQCVASIQTNSSLGTPTTTSRPYLVGCS